MAIMRGTMRFVFGIMALATLTGAPAAHAVCKSPKNICKHVDDCLQRTSDPNNKDAESIRAGVKTRNGRWCEPALRHAPAIWAEKRMG
jgi:demethoxyubiquinone hydroxylase (CLK1/Coq7/Cat5 family)